MGVFSVLSVYSSVKMVKTVNQQIEADTNVNYINTSDNHISFLKARLAMAVSDSVCLSLNLKDSLVLLELKGVEVYRAKISSYDISPVFDRIRPEIIQSWIENPFTTERLFSSIPRQVILPKKAPEDTTALAAPLSLPDTVHREAVCFQLYLDRGVRLQILESNAPHDEAFKNFQRTLRTEKTKSLTGSLFRFEVPEYNPWITIEIPGRKAKTILRSLPVHAKVAIRF
jgi:hypothetical protein